VSAYSPLFAKYDDARSTDFLTERACFSAVALVQIEASALPARYFIALPWNGQKDKFVWEFPTIFNTPMRINRSDQPQEQPMLLIQSGATG
jgi:hypothetical protein